MRKNIKKILLMLLISVLVIYNMTPLSYGSNLTQRLAGDDRYSTAIEISRHGWQQAAENVVLATGEDFPDALCAAPLARQLNAPILLTGKSSLDPRVESEIKRLGAKNIFIIGGQGVISKTIEEKLASQGLTVKRLYGNDRYETSLAVAKYSGAVFSKEIVIATGDDFPDALSIAAIAAKKAMPIILTYKSALPEKVKEYINEQGITKAYIIGGTGVISESIKDSLPAPYRISGKDRYATNLAVIREFAGDLDFTYTYLATGNYYPDALAGSALAPGTSSPIILVDSTSQQDVKELLQDKYTGIREVKVLGGEGVVQPQVVEYVVPKVMPLAISDITASVPQGKSFSLPTKVTASMSNNTTQELDITWTPASVNTANIGSYTFSGTVKDYGPKVTLTLTVYLPHPIMGEPEVSAEQMAAFLLSTNPNPKINCTALELAQMFIEEGRIEGVRGDIAFCQSIHETGWFKYGGQVLPEQNNYAGIGATNNSPVGKGAWFSSPREGVRAQIQHLKGYASKEPLKQECVDPRYSILEQNNLLGVAPNWEDLNGRWAVPGTTYGQSIMAQFEKLKAFK